MSWLSDRLGTTGKTPSIIKSIGNVAGGALVGAVPFGLGGGLDKVFNISGTQGNTGGVGNVVQTTGTNLQTQLDQASAAQKVQQNLPLILGVAGVGLLAYFAFKKK